MPPTRARALARRQVPVPSFPHIPRATENPYTTTPTQTHNAQSTPHPPTHAPAHDAHDAALGELHQNVPRPRRQQRLGRVVDDRGERPVIVEEDHHALGLERPFQPREVLQGVAARDGERPHVVAPPVVVVVVMVVMVVVVVVLLTRRRVAAAVPATVRRGGGRNHGHCLLMLLGLTVSYYVLLRRLAGVRGAASRKPWQVLLAAWDCGNK